MEPVIIVRHAEDAAHAGETLGLLLPFQRAEHIGSVDAVESIRRRCVGNDELALLEGDSEGCQIPGDGCEGLLDMEDKQAEWAG